MLFLGTIYQSLFAGYLTSVQSKNHPGIALPWLSSRVGLSFMLKDQRWRPLEGERVYYKHWLTEFVKYAGNWCNLPSTGGEKYPSYILIFYFCKLCGEYLLLRVLDP